MYVSLSLHSQGSTNVLCLQKIYSSHKHSYTSVAIIIIFFFSLFSMYAATEMTLASTAKLHSATRHTTHDPTRSTTVTASTYDNVLLNDFRFIMWLHSSQQCGPHISFCRAVNTLHTSPTAHVETHRNACQVIYKSYVQSNHIQLSDKVRCRLEDNANEKVWNVCMFDAAYGEVMRVLRDKWMQYNNSTVS